MELTPDEATALIKQLQSAHRMAAAFYAKILPTFDNVATELGATFYCWTPAETDPPPRKTSQPSRKWPWDLLPLYASHHTYMSTAGSGASREDFALTFGLYIDHSFSTSERNKLSISGLPDPITLPYGSALVEVMVFRISSAKPKPFADYFESSEWPKNDTWETVDTLGYMKARRTAVPLESVLMNSKDLVVAARTLLQSKPNLEPQLPPTSTQ